MITISNPNDETEVGVRQPESDRPLVVDLDETLLATDLLLESLFAYLSTNPLRVVKVVSSLSRGRAQLKADVARETSIDVALLPYNQEVLSLIQNARDSGREVYLASASNERYVERVADGLGLFVGWFASNDTRNLSGKAKADLLVERFGARGFDYIGNSRADLAVWAVAAGNVGVGAPARVAAELRRLDPAARFLPAPGRGLHDWLKLFRVHQWTKNGLVFVPILAAHLFTLSGIMAAVGGAVCFSLVASATYVINDLVDVQSDRKHRSKKKRPLASGTVPIGKALAAAVAFILIAFALALALSLPFAAVLATYMVATIAYSFWLKRKMMVDIVTLASLYTLRVIGGAAVVNMMPSEWIIAFSMFLFTSLALLKRYVELTGRIDASLPDPPDRNYRKTDVPMLGALAAASGLNAVTVFALYISSDTVHRLYRHPLALWIICPILLYWIGRALILADRRLIDDDPVKFALRDPISLLAVALIAFTMIAAA
jgi:4-hydroxybenzoate polyprenyltransferase